MHGLQDISKPIEVRMSFCTAWGSPRRRGCAGNKVPARGKASPHHIKLEEAHPSRQIPPAVSIAAMSAIGRNRTNGSSFEGIKPRRCQNLAAS